MTFVIGLPLFWQNSSGRLWEYLASSSYDLEFVPTLTGDKPRLLWAPSSDRRTFYRFSELLSDVVECIREDIRNENDEFAIDMRTESFW